MSLEMVVPVLTSMAAPLSATVIKSAKSWISGQSGKSLSMSDSRAEVEIENISKSDLEALIKATLNAHLEVSEDSSPPEDSRKSQRPLPAGQARQVKIDAANAVTQSQQIVISPVFKLVFLTVVALTIASGATAVIMSFVGNSSQPNQQAIFESMNMTWKLGLGAILGLLGGKTA